MNAPRIWVRGDGARCSCAAVWVRDEDRAEAGGGGAGMGLCLPHSLIQSALTEHPPCARCCSRHGHKAVMDENDDW